MHIDIPDKILSNTPGYYRIPLPNSYRTEQSIPLAVLVHHLSPNVAEAIRHLFRAGLKPGESYIQALRSAAQSIELELDIQDFASTTNPQSLTKEAYDELKI